MRLEIKLIKSFQISHTFYLYSVAQKKNLYSKCFINSYGYKLQSTLLKINTFEEKIEINYV